jgi:hypothetical protein
METSSDRDRHTHVECLVNFIYAPNFLLVPLLAGGREWRLLAGCRMRVLIFIRADIAFMTELA